MTIYNPHLNIPINTNIEDILANPAGHHDQVVAFHGIARGTTFWRDAGSELCTYPGPTSIHAYLQSPTLIGAAKMLKVSALCRDNLAAEVVAVLRASSETGLPVSVEGTFVGGVDDSMPYEVLLTHVQFGRDSYVLAT